MGNFKISDEEFGRMCARLNEMAYVSAHPGFLKEAVRYRETGVLPDHRLEQIDRILNINEQLSYDEWAIRWAEIALRKDETSESLRNEFTSIMEHLTDPNAIKKVEDALKQPTLNKEKLIQRLSSESLAELLAKGGGHSSHFKEPQRAAVVTLLRYPETVDHIVRTTISASTKKEHLHMMIEVFAALAERFEAYPEVDYQVIKMMAIDL